MRPEKFAMGIPAHKLRKQCINSCPGKLAHRSWMGQGRTSSQNTKYIFCQVMDMWKVQFSPRLIWVHHSIHDPTECELVSVMKRMVWTFWGAALQWGTHADYWAVWCQQWCRHVYDWCNKGEAFDLSGYLPSMENTKLATIGKIPHTSISDLENLHQGAVMLFWWLLVVQPLFNCPLWS